MARWVRRFPFLSLGAGSFAFFVALLLLELPVDSPAFRALATAWHVLGFGPHTAANLLARHAPNLPEALDAALVVALGLAPYAALDLAWSAWRGRAKNKTRGETR